MNIDEFVETLNGWQQRQVAEVVSIIREVVPGSSESIKWGNPYFDYHGGFIKLFVAKDWINVYFYKGYLLSSGLFETSDNERMRTVKLTENTPLDSAAFSDLVRIAAEANQK